MTYVRAVSDELHELIMDERRETPYLNTSKLPIGKRIRMAFDVLTGNVPLEHRLLKPTITLHSGLNNDPLDLLYSVPNHKLIMVLHDVYPNTVENMFARVPDIIEKLYGPTDDDLSQGWARQDI